MNPFGLNIVTSDAVPKDQIFLMPPWIGECRIIAGVAVRFRQSVTEDGKTWHHFSPLTEDELRQIAVLKNCSSGTISPRNEMTDYTKHP